MTAPPLPSSRRETPLPCVLVCLYGCLFVLTPSADYVKFPEHLHSRLSQASQTHVGWPLCRFDVGGKS